MADNKRVSGIRVLQTYNPTTEDLSEARKLTSKDCPRRYCWWWHSLSFDWEMSIDEGCKFLVSKKHIDWNHADTPCCRCDPNSNIDHFEPRDPQIIQDEISVDKLINKEDT